MKNIFQAVRTKKGFTLIELIVVIAILGILAAILIPQFTGFQDNARKKTLLSEAGSVSTAVSAYRADTGTYPSTTQALVDGGYLTSELAANVSDLQSDDGGFTYASAELAYQVSKESATAAFGEVTEYTGGGAATTAAG